MKTICVIGDCLLDEYLPIVGSKANPEVPEQIVYRTEPNRLIQKPGGSGNVAYQLSVLPVKTILVGALDKEARGVYESLGLDCSYCITAEHTPRKRRLVDSVGKVVQRYDIERVDPVALPFIPDADFYIYSDYDKGLFHLPFTLRHPCIVDPKNDLEKWKGCDYLKLNKGEAMGFVNDKYPAWGIQQIVDCSACIVTDAGNGYNIATQTFHKRVNNKATGEVASVIGGGDSFIAHLAYWLAEGVNLAEACGKAYAASCRYVQGRFNAPVGI